MGPIERSLPSILEQMRRYGSDPKAGRPVPLEAVYECNVIREDQFDAIRDEMEREARAARNEGALSDIDAEVLELHDRMRRADVPPKYVDCYIDGTNVDSLNGGRWLYVCGQDQDAVNTRACASMKGWMRANRYGTATYRRSTTLLSEFHGFDTEADSMSRYSGVGILLLANVGMESATDWALSKVGELLERRMTGGSAPTYGMPTIITSGLGPSELAQHFANRGSDQMARSVMQMLQRQAILVEA